MLTSYYGSLFGLILHSSKLGFTLSTSTSGFRGPKTQIKIKEAISTLGVEKAPTSRL